MPREVCDYKYTAWNIMCRRSNAAVYIEEDRLEEVRAGVVRGAASLRPWEFISSYTGQDLQGQPAVGIIFCGYDFPGLHTRELAALFGRAIEELKLAALRSGNQQRQPRFIQTELRHESRRDASLETSD